MREVYGSRGFLEAIFIPNVNLDSSSTVKLNIEVREGPQYRMDKLEIVGSPETADKLQVRWELQAGKIFDAGYVATFLDKVRLLLPADFTQENGVQLFTDCNDGTVAVHIHLTADAQHAALDRAKHVECSSAELSAESSQK